MDSLKEFFHQTIAILLFILAITTSIYLLNAAYNLFQHLSTIENSSILFQDNMVVMDNSIEYNEIIAKLLGNIECDIQINDILIKKETFRPFNFEYTVIPKTKYSISYIIENGILKRILYSSIF